MEEKKFEIEFSPEEEDQIEVFKNTYNALYIEHFSENKINYLKMNLNPVYQKLIENLKSPRSYANYEFIEGPHTIHKFKMEDIGKPKKSFYIFGEQHRISVGDCFRLQLQELEGGNYIDFHKYLKLLSQESPSFIDFYSELPMVKTKVANQARGLISVLVNRMYNNLQAEFKTEYEIIKNLSSYTFEGSSRIFNELKEEFKTCIQPETRNVSECQLIRIHNIDIRDTYDFDEIPPDYGLNLLCQIIKIGMIKKKSNSEILNVIKRFNLQTNIIIDNLRVVATDPYTIVKKYFKLNKRLKTEVNKRTYERENIERFIISKINRIYPEDSTTRVYPITPVSFIAGLILDSITNNQFDFSTEELKNFLSVFILLDGLKVDMYALARIFKTYDIYKNNPTGSFQPVESKNIIIYAGNTHSETYVEFLEYLKYQGREVKLLYRYNGLPYISCVKATTGEPSKIELNEPLKYVPVVEESHIRWYTPPVDEVGNTNCSIQ